MFVMGSKMKATKKKTKQKQNNYKMLAFYGVVHGVACPAEEPHAEAGRVAMDSVFTSLFLFFFF